MNKTDVKLTDISVGIMNKKRQVQRIPLHGLLLIYGHLVTRDSCSFPKPLHLNRLIQTLRHFLWPTQGPY